MDLTTVGSVSVSACARGRTFAQRAAVAAAIASCVLAIGPRALANDAASPSSVDVSPAAEPVPVAADAIRESWDRHVAMRDASPFRGLPWRSIGPVVQGGRVVDIEVLPGKPYTFYVAYASGGLWKTTNNGVTLEPVFEGQPASILGDIAIDPADPDTLWVGTGENNSSRSSYGGAGVFRSTDAGATWEWKGLADTDRIGRVIVDPTDSNRVWVAALGKLYTPGGARGVYRTEDGGTTWRRVLGVDDGRTGFVDLAIDPSDPKTLYASAWERERTAWNFRESGLGSGVWVTRDAGDTWSRLEGGLPTGEHVGRIGLAVAPSAPDTVYAVVDNQEILPESHWDLGDGAVTPKRLRGMSTEEFLEQDPEEVEDFLRAYDLDPELDAEALRRLVEDGEVTIQDLLDALSDANASLFETDIRGAELWRSDDRGTTWRRTHDDPIRDMVYTYGYYFGQVRVAPDAADRVYILGVPLLTSGDGGATWRNINEPNVHVDHHDLWIDPAHPQRIVSGNDGGLNMSFDGGASWLKLNPIAVGQFYTVAVDMAEPYNVYGGLQDNGVYRGSSRSIPGVTPAWSFIGGGDGMYVQVDPRDDRTTYLGYQFGNYARIDADGSRSPVKPRNKLTEPALRYNWQTPIRLSSHNPDVVYFGANRVFRSLDRGTTWTAISEELTTATERGDVPFATVTTLDESSLAFGVLWAGTDDGLVWVTRDGGVTWADVTPPIAVRRWVSRVEPSRHDRARAYVSHNGYRDDDLAAYVFRTDDFGETWVSIGGGLPAEAVNVVREDPVNPDVLYVGTDRGAYVSLDRGASWDSLAGGLPTVPVHDLVVHPRDRELVAGTHGRSVWVVDALPVQELDGTVRESELHVFHVDDARYRRAFRSRHSRWFRREITEPRHRVPYWSAAAGTATLTVRDADGRELRRVEIETVAGVNQFEWDLTLDPDLALSAERARVEAAASEQDEGSRKSRKRKKREKAAPAESGDAERPNRSETPWAEAVRLGRPLYATPGAYTIRIERGDASSERTFEIEPAPPREPRTRPKPPIRGEDDRP